MKRAIILMAAVLLFGGLLTTGGHVSADGTCENVQLLTVNGETDVSFTFNNDNGRYEAFAAGDGGWWVGDYRSGRLSFLNTIRYYDGNGNTARARNNGDGSVIIQTADGNVVRSGSLTVDGSGSTGPTNILVDDLETALLLMDLWKGKQRKIDDYSWATCHV